MSLTLLSSWHRWYEPSTLRKGGLRLEGMVTILQFWDWTTSSYRPRRIGSVRRGRLTRSHFYNSRIETQQHGLQHQVST